MNMFLCHFPKSTLPNVAPKTKPNYHNQICLCDSAPAAPQVLTMPIVKACEALQRENLALLARVSQSHLLLREVSLAGVCKLWASLQHTGRRVVLGHTLNTLWHLITKTSHNILSKFMILCGATFTAILGCTQPVGRRSDTPANITFGKLMF